MNPHHGFASPANHVRPAWGLSSRGPLRARYGHAVGQTSGTWLPLGHSCCSLDLEAGLEKSSERLRWDQVVALLGNVPLLEETLELKTRVNGNVSL